MIAKRIDKKGGRGLTALGRYILRETGSPASWQRQAEYATDLARGGEGGPKVEWVSISNCGAVCDPGRAIQLMHATRQQNARIRSGATIETGYHLVISFEPNEKPEREFLKKIEADLIETIGLGEHQRISAAHRDTEHLHVHVVVHLIHPTTFLKAEPFYDKTRLMEKCAELEVEYGLSRTNHGDFQAVFEVEVKDRAGADLVRSVMAGLGWQDFHQAAAAHGLRVKKLGGGITIARADQSQRRLKVSAIDRGLSLAKLSDRFGPWEDASPEVLAGLREWDRSASRPAKPPPARHTRSGVGSEGGLYGRFTADLAKARAARVAALQLAKFEHRRWRSESIAFHRDRVGRAWEGQGSPEVRRAEANRRKAERDKDRKDRAERVLQDTAAINKAHPVPSWLEWLEAKAASGEAEAVAALSRRKRLPGLAAPDQDEPAKRIDGQTAWRRRDGALSYELSDGGRLADHGANVDFERVSDGASALALRIMAERYGLGTALAVTGSDQFRRSLAVLAGRSGAEVHFEEPELDAQRMAAGGLEVAAMVRLAAGREARQAFMKVRVQPTLDRGQARDRGRA
ncbi:TraI/MobA(P) family conjugative relaxase [Belnapia rosea]|uniref:Relaxase/Mobilisation nuclease domain-containing protein n=1 Tax=Belnapia rosea TaxID=938405 RepID=A0A1G6Z0L1_9PROT|nr:TraI/MobA(P) family conjugative relaxase [Belnapia rosea]SDD96284.1 Relaxase/Mobilisation nuclease domain-containing protein [Belnapia rosea]